MKTKWWLRTLGVAVVGVAAPLAARAQAPAPALSPMGEVRTEGYNPGSGFGVELLLGGGYSNFTGSTAQSLTAGAGTWDARMVFGSRLPVGFELAYVGSAQDLTVTGLDTGAYLLGNGGEASLRLGIPMAFGQWLVAPFITGGVGWNYYSLQNSNTNTSIVLDHDSNFTVPLGVGIDGIYQGFTMNVRATLRPSFDNDILGDASLTTWGISGNIGFEF